MIVVDTGVAYAAGDRDDPDHPACAQLLAAHAGELHVPTPVVVETSWLLERRLGPAAESDFLRSVRAGELNRVDLTDD